MNNFTRGKVKLFGEIQVYRCELSNAPFEWVSNLLYAHRVMCEE